jgi:hypothetical protein
MEQDAVPTKIMTAEKRVVLYKPPREGDTTPFIHQGITTISIPRPLKFRANSIESFLWIKFIRDFSAYERKIEWQLELSEEIPYEKFMAFPPPGALFTDAKGLSEWTTNYRRDLFYWRRGPNFVSIKDARAFPPRVLTTDKAETFTTFLQCVSGLPKASADADAIDELLSEGLVIMVGGMYLALPHRIRRWPVPCSAI